MRSAGRVGFGARERLLLAMMLLVALQVVHLLDVLRYTDDVGITELLVAPDAIVGIGTAGIGVVLLWRGNRWARTWALVVGLVIALAFVQHHLLPTYNGGANPYFTFEDGNRADWFRWLVVVALIVVGSWTAWTARRSEPGLA